MSSDGDEKKSFEVSLPGEWTVKKLFGPVLSEIGDDLQRAYAHGRDRIIAAACEKVPDPDDGKQANARVTVDVMQNGAFADSEVCVEYFGGILASSRSESGDDDSAIQFASVVKSLSSDQLHLHYVIYKSLQEMWVNRGVSLNIGLEDDLLDEQVYFVVQELKSLGLRPETALSILHKEGLVHGYQADTLVVEEARINYMYAIPTTFGALLYCYAHNAIDEWLLLPERRYEDFAGVALPTTYVATEAKLVRWARQLKPDSGS